MKINYRWMTALFLAIAVGAVAAPSDRWEVFCKFRGSHHGGGGYSYDGAREYCKSHERNGHDCMFQKQ